jgi:4'-phosphopantetheinyl transferase
MCGRHQLSPSSKLKLNSRKSDLAKKQFIASRALIQHIYIHDFNTETDNTIQIIEGVTPTMEDSPELHIAISHSQEYVAVAISEQPIGLDIERPHRGRNYQEIADKAFHPNESAWIKGANDGVQLESRFFEIWTARESLFKLGYLENLLDQSIDVIQEIKKEDFSPFFHKEPNLYLFAVTTTPATFSINFV